MKGALSIQGAFTGALSCLVLTAHWESWKWNQGMMGRYPNSPQWSYWVRPLNASCRFLSARTQSNIHGSRLEHERRVGGRLIEKSRPEMTAHQKLRSIKSLVELLLASYAEWSNLEVSPANNSRVVLPFQKVRKIQVEVLRRLHE